MKMFSIWSKIKGFLRKKRILYSPSLGAIEAMREGSNEAFEQAERNLSSIVDDDGFAILLKAMYDSGYSLEGSESNESDQKQT